MNDSFKRKWGLDLNRCLSKGHINSQKINEKILIPTNHEENANKNYNDIVHYPNKNGNYQNK
jgi:phage pi2 protein 07